MSSAGSGIPGRRPGGAGQTRKAARVPSAPHESLGPRCLKWHVVGRKSRRSPGARAEPLGPAPMSERPPCPERAPLRPEPWGGRLPLETPQDAAALPSRLVLGTRGRPRLDPGGGGEAGERVLGTVAAEPRASRPSARRAGPVLLTARGPGAGRPGRRRPLWASADRAPPTAASRGPRLGQGAQRPRLMSPHRRRSPRNPISQDTDSDRPTSGYAPIAHAPHCGQV